MKRYFLAIVGCLFIYSCSEKSAQQYFEDFEYYYQNNNAQKAVSTIDKLLTIDSTSLVLYNARGLANMQGQNYKEAIIDFSKSLSIDNKNILALAYRGKANMLNKKYDEAIEDLREAILLRGFNVINDTLHNYKINIKELHDTPLLLDIVHDRGRAYFETYNLIFALDDFNTCINTALDSSLDSKFDKIPESYYWRAHTLIRMNELNLACADLQIAAESGLNQAQADLIKYCQ